MSLMFNVSTENKKCRLCLGKTETYINLFQGKFQELIFELTSVKISLEDDFPKIACIKCIDEIQQAMKTRTRIIECDKKLQEMKLNENVETESENFPEVVILSDYSDEEHEENSIMHELLAGYDEFDEEEEEEDNPDVFDVKGEFLADSNDITYDDDEPDEPKEPESTPPPPKQFNILFKDRQRKRKTFTKVLNPTGKFKCDQCDLQFQSKYSHYLHSLKHKKSQCKICGILIRSDNMSKHMDCHTSGPRICDLCGKTCKNMESLRGHIFYMHRKSADEYKCDQCDRSFRMKYKLELHKKKEHIGVRGHICSTCNKGFFTVRDMNHHIQMKHLKLRPHVCPHCERGFSSKYALKTHVRQHTNETPYKCYICAEGFRQNVSLRTHLKSKHNIEEEKNFSCEFCDKAFSTDFALKVHLRLHSDDNYKCEHCEECFQQKVFLINHLKTIHNIQEELIFINGIKKDGTDDES